MRYALCAALAYHLGLGVAMGGGTAVPPPETTQSTTLFDGMTSDGVPMSSRRTVVRGGCTVEFVGRFTVEPGSIEIE